MRAQQERRRDREAEGLGGLHVDHELEQYCTCGRIAQRDESVCWYCDIRVPETEKRIARAARWRARLVAPDFQTIGSRVRYREAVAEATMEGELMPPVAAIGLKAVNDAGDDLYRDKTGVDPGAFTVIIERLAPPPGVSVLPPPRSLAARCEPIATAPSPASTLAPPPVVVVREDGMAAHEPVPAVEIERLETLG
jgi:hypothetical protein